MILPSHYEFAAQFISGDEVAIHTVRPPLQSNVRLLQASRNRRVFFLPERWTDSWKPIVGIVSLLAAAGIAYGAVGAGGWQQLFSLSFVIALTLAAGANWLFVTWWRNGRSSKVVLLTPDRLDIICHFGGRNRTSSIPIDSGSFALLRPIVTSETDRTAVEPKVITAEIVVKTGEIQLAFGRGFSVPEQSWLVERINEFTGTGYARLCPDCGTLLTPGDIDLETGQLSCSACDWRWEPPFVFSPHSRVTVPEATDDQLVVEISSSPIRERNARIIVIGIAAVTLVVAYITMRVLAQVIANVGFPFSWLVFSGLVFLLFLLIFGKCYLTWRRARDSVTRLTITPDELSLEKLEWGRLSEKTASLGPSSSASVFELENQPILAVHGAIQTVRIDEQVAPHETQLLANRINCFLKRPLWAPQLEFPLTCPNCTRSLSAADVELGQGKMQCDNCDWKNDPAEFTRFPGSLGELVDTFQSQYRVLRELSQRDIPRDANFDKGLRAGQHRGTATDSDERLVKQALSQFHGVRKMFWPQQALPFIPPRESAKPLDELRQLGASVDQLGIRHLRIDLPNHVSLSGTRSPLLLFCLGCILLAVFRLWFRWGQWPGMIGTLILFNGLFALVFGIWLWLGKIRFDVTGDTIECFYHLGPIGYRRVVRCEELQSVALRGMLGMAEVLEIRGASRRIMVAFMSQPNLVHFLYTAIHRHLTALHIKMQNLPNADDGEAQRRI